MRPPTNQPRVAHAYPRTPDARASRAAVAFRAADRALERSRLRGRRRVALPASGLLAAAAVLLLASQSLGSAPVSTTSAGATGESAMDLSLRHPRPETAAGAETPAPSETPALSTSPQPPADRSGRPTVDDLVAAATGYHWPLEHARITQGFGRSSGGLFVVDGHRFHDGIDIANFCGAPILAAHDGVVLAASRRVISALGWVGDTAGYDAWFATKRLWSTQARVIVIDDGDGFRSVYIHMHRIDVKVGDVVKAGQQIGLEGSSGHASGCHLHFSLYSPNDSARWTTNAKDVAKFHLPVAEIGRIDPLLLLPPLADGWITWGWGAQKD